MAAIIEFRPAPRIPARLAIVVGLATIIVVSAVILLSGIAGGSSGATGAGASGGYVQVGPGDTMLSILQEHQPASASEMREAMAEMAALNGGTHRVEVGQVVALPAEH